MAPTLLLADDNSTIQRLVEMTFAEHGITVIGVSDGQEAIDRLTVRRPDIALVGVSLNRRDGYEVARFVQREPSLRGLPVLLVAGAFDTIDEARVRESGAAGVLFKPFEPAQVINRVKELLGLSAKQGEQTESVPASPPQPGRLLTSSEGPAHRDSMATRPEQHSGGSEPKFAARDEAPASDPSAEQVGPAAEPAAVGATQGGGDSYFGHLDEAFDALDAQVASHSTPSDRASTAGPPLPHHAAPGPDVRQPFVGATGSSFQSAAEATRPPDAPTAPSRFSAASADSASAARADRSFALDDEWLSRSAARDAASGVSPAMADAFALILAQEQGERIPDQEEAPREPSPHPVSFELTDDVIDRIAQRVADRLIAGPLGERVTRAAHDVSERLVREEIARIRASAAARTS